MRTMALVAWSLGGCGLGISGAAIELADGGGPQAGPDAAAAVDDASIGDAGVDAGSTCDPTKCAGRRCLLDGGCSFFADCRGLRDEGAPTGNGVYPLRQEGGTNTFDAYCEMTLADGGWTLVGQSAGTQESDDFGWGEDTGSVTDTTRPYSIDAFARRLRITEVLAVVGTRESPVAAYVIRPPANFTTNFEASAGAVLERRRIMNPACTDPTIGAEPSMFAWMGHTERDDHFFFRDGSNHDGYGLRAVGWRLNYDGCPQDGRFHQKHGMLFVR
ncbi:MAG: hypothetical protein KIT84_23765 [Labilithrix sp.]|nr:hypothetical protein [Labilithrix sp.]MCW5814066.1 hypothetical protein [Labilithrix sp.]